MLQHTLLLNADATPVSWLPLSTLTWQTAIRLLWLQSAEMLHPYDDWVVHSPSTTMVVPAVIILRNHVAGFRRWRPQDDSPQSHLVFLRDLYTCQYCLRRFPRRSLTIDHVIPRYHGGKTLWSNIATSCAPCNTRRGCDRTILPANRPFLPSMGLLIRNLRQFPIRVPHESWNHYLRWDPELVKIFHNKNDVLFDDDFDTGTNFEIDSLQ